MEKKMPVRRVITYASRKRTYADSFPDESHSEQDSLPTPPTSSQSSDSSGPESNASPRPRALSRPLIPASPAPSRDDAQSVTSQSESTTRPPLPKRKKFTQMRIDLGGNPQKRCKDCGMEYIPSNAEDAKLHKEFHAANVGGVDVPTGWKDKWTVVAKCAPRAPRRRINFLSTKRAADGSGARDVIVEVAAKDKPTLRKWAKRALEVVERELGAIETSEEALWKFEGKDENRAQRFRTYLYVHGKKCVGLCLTQRIVRAAKVDDATLDAGSVTPTKKVPAELGISRIWVSKEYRRLGIARELLNVVEEFAWTGEENRKPVMAFSQPTESGGELAKAWFGHGNPLLIYDEAT